MGRRRRKKKRKALDYISIPKVGSQVKRSILVILVIALGAISLLAYFDLAGNVGASLKSFLMIAFGFGGVLFPIYLLVWAFILYKENRLKVRTTSYIGFFLFFISFQSLLHIIIKLIDKDNFDTMIRTGYAGGYVGKYLATVFAPLDIIGGLIVLILLFLLSIILMFNVSLRQLIGSESIFAKIFSPIKIFFGKLFAKKEDDYTSDDSKIHDDVSDDKKPEDAEIVATALATEPDFNLKEKTVDEKNEKKEDKHSWQSSHIKIDMPLELLSVKVGKATSGDLKENMLIIHRTLENFGIEVEMGETSVGPTVTQYTFKPAEGIKLARITTLNNDLSLALAAHPIRIEAPIPGKSLVGVEVPNRIKAIVGLRSILDTPAFKNRKSNLMIALGKDVSGEPWIYDIAKMPHLLVAGATNSGKSVCLNAIIVSLLYQNNPDDLRFIMVDPKRVELPVYNGIPHLLTPVITNVSKTINALKWCLNEMDRRFEELSLHKKRNIQAYNDYAVKFKKGEGKMPYIIFIVDELADLMVVASRDIEASVIRLAQMARAVGIHLVLATQRPSVDVITGLIKANTPSRIAFSVASAVDSKTILDSSGAEKLLGKGDMLFQTAEISKPKRIQGAFVDDDEIKRIVDYIRHSAGDAEYLDDVTERQRVQGVGGVGLEGNVSDEDDLLEEAKEIVINMNKASASLLQRKLSVGYARAARLLDMLEEIGVVGPSNGSKAREIFVSREQYIATQSMGVSSVSTHSMEDAEEPEDYLDTVSEPEPEEIPRSSDGAEQDEEEEIVEEEKMIDDGKKIIPHDKFAEPADDGDSEKEESEPVDDDMDNFFGR